MVDFKSYSPPSDYLPKPRDPRDDDRAARVYASCHYIRTMHQARTLGPDGAMLDIHPADAVDLDDEDEQRWDQDQEARARLPAGSVVMDALSAGIILQVADALGDQNRARFLALELGKMGRVAWRLANGS